MINNTYGSNRGLESQIIKLKEDNGLDPGRTITESTEEEKIVPDVDDPQDKKVVNYKK